MQKRRVISMADRELSMYVDIKQTRCGKCKRLRGKLWNTAHPYYCTAHGEALPEIVVHFFGEGCKEFEEIER